MIVSVFVRRLKDGATFEDFVQEWEADVGFGATTRVVNAVGVDDPREVLTVGFVDVSADELRVWLAAAPPSEQVRHERIDTVVESTTLRAMYELGTEHDFTHEPRRIDLAGPESLFAAFREGPA